MQKNHKKFKGRLQHVLIFYETAIGYCVTKWVSSKPARWMGRRICGLKKWDKIDFGCAVERWLFIFNDQSPNRAYRFPHISGKTERVSKPPKLFKYVEKQQLTLGLWWCSQLHPSGKWNVAHPRSATMRQVFFCGPPGKSVGQRHGSSTCPTARKKIVKWMAQANKDNHFNTGN